MQYYRPLMSVFQMEFNFYFGFLRLVMLNDYLNRLFIIYDNIIINITIQL